MSINSVALRGYGNGTINGTIAGVATRGYIIIVSPTTLGIESLVKSTFGVVSPVTSTVGVVSTISNTLGIESTS